MPAFQRREPGSRPGERMLDGKPYVFNADLLKRYLHEERIATAPADLTTLSDTDLMSLNYACTGRWHYLWAENTSAAAIEADRIERLQQHVEDERARRGLTDSFKGKVA